jgi:hypothetical protein
MGSVGVGVSPSAVKPPPVEVGVGEFSVVSLVTGSEAVVVGIRVGELCAVMGATSRATSLDVKGSCAGPLGMALREESGRTSEGLMEMELAL